MGSARSTRIRALSKDHLVLNTLALLIHGQKAEDARRFLERLSTGSRRRSEQSLRTYRFAPNADAQHHDLRAVLALLPRIDHRYEPLVPRQQAVVKTLGVLPAVFGGMVALGGMVTAALHWRVAGLATSFVGIAGLGNLYVPKLPVPAWPGLQSIRFFETVAGADALIVPLRDEDDPASSLWVAYNHLVAPLKAARAARKARARADEVSERPAGSRLVLPMDAEAASDPSEPPAPRPKKVAEPVVAGPPKLDLQAVRNRVLSALEDAPPARLPTDRMSIEDRVALLEEHRQRLQARIDREEGVALASKAVVEDFLDVAHESSPDRLTKSGGRSAGAPLVAYGLTRTLGTLMQNKPYLVKNGLKETTVDGLTNDYIKMLRATYRQLVEDKRYAMSYHMVAQGFSEWDLHVFRTIERCLKNNDPTAADDLIDLEMVLGGYNMDHCIKSLPLMLLSIQGFALSLDMKSKGPGGAKYVDMANDVRRILKNLQEQIPEDVYLKSMNLVKATQSTTT